MLKPVVVVALLGVVFAQWGCSSFQTHAARDLRAIARNPEAHRGQMYAFYGRVIDASENATGLTLQMVVEDSPQIPGELLVAHFPARGTKVARGDNAKVLGRITSRVRGPNAFGGVAEGVGMDAIAVRAAGGGYLPSEEDSYRAWERGTLFTRR